MNSYIKTGQSISFVYNGRPYSVDSQHDCYADIVNLVMSEKYADAIDLIKPIGIVGDIVDEASSKGSSVRIADGAIYLNDEDISHTSIGTRILSFVKQKLPTQPLIKFLKNLEDNPSFNSRKQLYKFLEHSALPVTNDGCFLAYKSVRDDFKDWHSNTIDNSVGQVVTMERHKIDENPASHCSFGLHAGALDYAQNFHGGQTMVIVKINPRDVVSVPNDHNCQKLRCCKYEVVAVKKNELNDTYSAEY